MHLERSGQNLISHYGPGVLSVNGSDYHSNLLITCTEVVQNWLPEGLESLCLDHFSPLLAAPDSEAPEILLLGTGNEHRFPDLSLMAQLASHNISLEVMNTRAACRTYSVLVGEYRSVAAALIQLDA